MEQAANSVLRDALPIAVKAVVGGCLVVALSMLSDAFKPKAFAGLFAAAPSVAIASLALTAGLTGSSRAAQAAVSMVAGAVGLVAFCATAALLERKVGAVVSSGIAWLSWAACAGLMFWVFLQ